MNKDRGLKTIIFVISVVSIMFAFNISADAKTTKYSKIEYNKVIKIGSNYFKESNDGIYCGESIYSLTKVISKVYSGYTNGETIYYLDRTTTPIQLKKYTISSRKAKTLKLLPNHKRSYEEDSWYISTVNGKNIYLTCGSFEKWKQWTYMYNTESKKLKKVANDAAIFSDSKSGKYVLVEHNYTTDVSGVSLSIYKLTSKGMSKVKHLGNACHCTSIYKGKYYFVKYTNPSMKSGTIYRCNVNGKGLKKLGNINASGQYSQVLAFDYNDKYCMVNNGRRIYKYKYK